MRIKQNIKKESYKFIPNKPVGKDAFDNDPQEDIAKILKCKIINDDNFKIIGIDGSWGVGKSNLVEILKRKETGVHFFIYDVWGHQEDQQKVAILEELIDFLKSEKIHNKSEGWDPKLDTVLGQKEKNIIKRKRSQSLGVAISLIALLINPITNAFGREIETKFKFFIYSVPLLIVLGFYIYYFFTADSEKGNRFVIAWNRLYSVYSEDDLTETIEKISTKRNPSVKDLRKWFKKIDDNLIEKVVIVFDNFDRLPKKHIRSLWSFIHMFFSEENKREAYKNIKVILPFDREHLQGAFADLDTDRKEEKSTFSDDYINKTFDVVFRIPEPIMSDWKNFFREQWKKKALMGSDEEELEAVIHVFEFLNRRITPREINSLINEIITLKLLNEKYKARYIAIYILKKKCILKNPLKSISELKYLKGLKSIYNNDEFRKQITAIVYQVDVDTALEVVYTSKLRKALIKQQINEFNKICQEEFVNDIFFGVISGLENFENPIRTLNNLDKSKTKLENHQLKEAWKSIYYRVRIDFEVDEMKLDDWQKILLKEALDNEYLKVLFSGFSDMLKEDNVQSFLNAIDSLPEKLNGEQVKSYLPKKEVSPKVFLTILDSKGEDYKTYKVKSSRQKIDGYLKELDIDEILEIENTKILFNDFEELPGYKAHLKDELVKYSKKDDVFKVNDLIIKLKEADGKQAGLEEILSDNRIYNLYKKSKNEELSLQYDLLAMRIARANKFNSNYTGAFQKVLNQKEPKLIKKIKDRLFYYIKYDELLISARKFAPKSELLKEVIKNLMNQETAQNKLNASRVLKSKYYKEIIKNLDIDKNIFLKALSKGNYDFRNGKVLEANYFSSLNKDFAQDCLSKELDHISIVQNFQESFNKSFSSFSKEDYEQIFKNDRSFYFKNFQYLKTSSLTQESLSAFERHFKNKLENHKLNDKWWKVFNKYYKADKNISFKKFMKNIRDVIIFGGFDLQLEEAKTLIPVLLELKILIGEKDIFRKIFKDSFLDDNDFVEMLIKNAEDLKKVYQNGKGDDPREFRNVINDKRKNNKNIDTLARKIVIRRSPQNN